MTAPQKAEEPAYTPKQRKQREITHFPGNDEIGAPTHGKSRLLTPQVNCRPRNLVWAAKLGGCQKERKVSFCPIPEIEGSGTYSGGSVEFCCDHSTPL